MGMAANPFEAHQADRHRAGRPRRGADILEAVPSPIRAGPAVEPMAPHTQTNCSYLLIEASTRRTDSSTAFVGILPRDRYVDPQSIASGH